MSWCQKLVVKWKSTSQRLNVHNYIMVSKSTSLYYKWVVTLKTNWKTNCHACIITLKSVLSGYSVKKYVVTSIICKLHPDFKCVSWREEVHREVKKYESTSWCQTLCPDVKKFFMMSKSMENTPWHQKFSPEGFISQYINVKKYGIT